MQALQGSDSVQALQHGSATYLDVGVNAWQSGPDVRYRMWMLAQCGPATGCRSGCMAWRMHTIASCHLARR